MTKKRPVYLRRFCPDRSAQYGLSRRDLCESAEGMNKDRAKAYMITASVAGSTSLGAMKIVLWRERFIICKRFTMAFA